MSKYNKFDLPGQSYGAFGDDISDALCSASAYDKGDGNVYCFNDKEKILFSSVKEHYDIRELSVYAESLNDKWGADYALIGIAYDTDTYDLDLNGEEFTVKGIVTVKGEKKWDINYSWRDRSDIRGYDNEFMLKLPQNFLDTAIGKHISINDAIREGIVEVHLTSIHYKTWTPWWDFSEEFTILWKISYLDKDKGQWIAYNDYKTSFYRP